MLGLNIGYVLTSIGMKGQVKDIGILGSKMTVLWDKGQALLDEKGSKHLIEKESSTTITSGKITRVRASVGKGK